jgi:hypothetical protein
MCSMNAYHSMCIVIVLYTRRYVLHACFKNLSNFSRAFQHHWNRPDWSLYIECTARGEKTFNIYNFSGKIKSGGNLGSMCVENGWESYWDVKLGGKTIKTGMSSRNLGRQTRKEIFGQERIQSLYIVT